MTEDSPVVTTPQTKRRARAALGRGATLRKSPTITLKFHLVGNLDMLHIDGKPRPEEVIEKEELLLYSDIFLTTVLTTCKYKSTNIENTDNCQVKERWHDDVLQEVLRKRKLPIANWPKFKIWHRHHHHLTIIEEAFRQKCALSEDIVFQKEIPSVTFWQWPNFG